MQRGLIIFRPVSNIKLYIEREFFVLCTCTREGWFKRLKLANVFFLFQAWLDEAHAMKGTLDEANAAAQKMTLHKDADEKYAAFCKRYVVIEATAKDWIDKYEKMVAVWQKQVEF